MRLLVLTSILASGLLSGNAADVCTEEQLRQALQSGGAINFTCDAFIEITNTLQITTDVVLDAGTNQVTLSGGGKVRIFEVADGVSFTAQAMKFVNGAQFGTHAARDPGVDETLIAIDAFGGALAATNTMLKFEDCVFSNNVARGVNDTDPESIPGYAGNAYGGAIYIVDSRMDVINSRFIWNSALPGLRGSSVFNDAVFAADSVGGAIFSQGGTLKLIHSEFKSNAVVTAGGAVAAESGEIEIDQSVFEANSVQARTAGRFAAVSVGDGRGGALSLTNSTILVAGSKFLRNQITGSGGYFSGGGSLLGGALFADGGISVSNSFFFENSIQGGAMPKPPTNSAGGAIWVGGEALITQSRFLRNNVIGADANLSPGLDPGPVGEGFGGAVFSGGTSRITETSFLSNTVSGGAVFHLFGGGIRYYGRALGSAVYASSALMTNATVAFNTVQGWSPAALGGAIYLEGTNLALDGNHFYFSTVVSNELKTISETTWMTNQSWNQIKMNTNASATFRGTIVSGGSSNVIDGLVNDVGHNISSDLSFSEPTSLNETDAKLGKIGFYSGLTETIPVLLGSPAINAVTSGAFPATDQRGRSRPHDAAADIGAYEVSPPFVVQGKIRHGIELAAVALTASGDPVGIDDSTGQFIGFFTSAGTLTPAANGLVFFPADVALNPGTEIFNAEFTGYYLNEIALEPTAGASLLVTFAAETAGDYQLLSSSDLSSWNNSGTVQTVAARALFRTEVAPGTSPQFFRIVKR